MSLARMARSVFALVFIVLCSANWAAMAQALEPPTRADLDRIADALEGRLVLLGLVFYHIETAHMIELGDGFVTLAMEADPLLEARFSLFESVTGERFDEAHFDPDAACGTRYSDGGFQGLDFRILQDGMVIGLHDAFPDVSGLSGSSRKVMIDPEALEKLHRCADQVARQAEAVPFRWIEVRAGDRAYFEVLRTRMERSSYDELPGDDWIDHTTEVLIVPRGDARAEDFDVVVNAVSVIWCDEEMDSEFFDEKQGPDLRLERVGNRFLIGAGGLGAMQMAHSWTTSELQQVLARQFGSDEAARIEKQAICMPWLSEYRVSIRYRGEEVHQIRLSHASGC